MNPFTKSPFKVATHQLKSALSKKFSTQILQGLREKEPHIFVAIDSQTLFGNGNQFEFDIGPRNGLVFLKNNQMICYDSYISVKSAQFAKMLFRGLPILIPKIEKAFWKSDKDFTNEIALSQLNSPTIYLEEPSLWYLEVYRKDEYMVYTIRFNGFECIEATYEIVD